MINGSFNWTAQALHLLGECARLLVSASRQPKETKRMPSSSVSRIDSHLGVLRLDGAFCKPAAPAGGEKRLVVAPRLSSVHAAKEKKLWVLCFLLRPLLSSLSLTECGNLNPLSRLVRDGQSAMSGQRS